MMSPSSNRVAVLLALCISLFVRTGETGSLEPAAPPAPTMKSLSEVPPSWHRVIPNASDRFEIVMGGAAVLDHETGLVWEKSPDTRPASSWFNAMDGYMDGHPSQTTFAPSCTKRAIGGRLGWRLPTIEELATLVDPTRSSPALPIGHPFLGIKSGTTDYYWTASDWDDSASYAFSVRFSDGTILPNYVSQPNKGASNLFCWCVRSPNTAQNRK